MSTPDASPDEGPKASPSDRFQSPKPASIKGFALRTRPPGWMPDTITQSGTAREHLTPDEALGNVGGRQQAFANPLGHSLFQPVPGDPSAFDAWVLGVPLTAPPAGQPTEFYELLVALCSAIRRYNSTLYWLRRLRFHASAPKGSKPPEPNPGGPLDERRFPTPESLPDPASLDFMQLAKSAEAEWTAAVDNLREHLAPGSSVRETHPFATISADMVEMNGYIASTRVIVSPIPTSATHTTAGPEESSSSSSSSSSHISLSSGYQWPEV